MSDLAQVLENGYGTPRAWIYTPDGEVLRDYDGQPISKYLVEFEYEYDEESDDTCNMTFRFENLKSFELPYFQQDVILHVKWGYIVNGGKTISSPIRKVAIRDMETDYDPKGLKLTLMCTDLVSYLKNNQTQIVTNFNNPWTEKEVNFYEKAYDSVLDFVEEVVKGNYKASITVENVSTRIDKIGNRKLAEYNTKTGLYTQPVDNARVARQIDHTFRTERVQKGQSQTITNAIENLLKLVNTYKADEPNNQGSLILDSTDDLLQIRQRNFSQNIWKNFTFYGGTGELLSFSSNTNTRKVKSDTGTNTAVNPFTKQVESINVSTADSTSNGQIDYDEWFNKRVHEMSVEGSIFDTEQPKPNIDDGTFFQPGGKGYEEEVPPESWLQQSYEAYITRTEPTEKEWDEHAEEWVKYLEESIKNPLDQKPLPDMKFNNVDPYADRYMGQWVAKKNVITIPSRVVVNTPEFLDSLNNLVSGKKADIRREQALMGFVTESVQRKYEADAEVIGDPSIIKGKVIGISKVGRLDRGKWYIVSCSHKIDIGKGYITTMNLWRKPSPVKASAVHIASNPVFDRKTGELEFPQEVVADLRYSFFDEPKKNEVGSITDMDEQYDDRFIGESEVAMENRLDQLQSTEDYMATGNLPINPVADNTTNNDIY